MSYPADLVERPMFCKNCGNQLPEGAIFCDACGKSPSSAFQNASIPGWAGGPAATGYVHSAPALNPNLMNGGPVVRRKSTGIAVILALIVPGLGHLYLGKYIRAAIYFGLSLLLIILATSLASSIYSNGSIEAEASASLTILGMYLLLAVIYFVQLIDAAISKK